MSSLRGLSFLAFVPASALVCACGGSVPPETSTSLSAAPTLQPPSKPWSTLDQQQRKAHMRDHVLPVMEAHFTRADPARYASVSCESCHGADMLARDFKMPNPSLLALHPTGSDEQYRMVEEYPAMVKLMFNHVLPDMQRLLGVEPFDAATHTGFSCYACHPAADTGAETTP